MAGEDGASRPQAEVGIVVNSVQIPLQPRESSTRTIKTCYRVDCMDRGSDGLTLVWKGKSHSLLKVVTPRTTLAAKS